MINREEYLKFIDVLSNDEKFIEFAWGFVHEGDDLSTATCEHARDYAADKLKELINNYSKLEEEINDLKKNPPLKYAELKEGLWVWDNKYKEWIQSYPGINCREEPCICYSSYGYLDEYDEEYIVFEEGRFFRKEIVNNE